MCCVTFQRLVLKIVRFGEFSPLTALKRVERGRYPGLYSTFRSPPQSMWDFTIHPLGAQRPRWHIVPSLALIPSVTSQRFALEIVRFGESSPLTVLKRVERGRYLGLYIAHFVLLPSRCGTLHDEYRIFHHMYSRLLVNKSGNFSTLTDQDNLILGRLI